jgi:hypothetical protein
MFVIVCLLFVASHLENTPLILKYSSPATSWESQSLPIGNGYIGAGIFGGVLSESIVLNEKTLWSGCAFFCFVKWV